MASVRTTAVAPAAATAAPSTTAPAKGRGGATKVAKAAKAAPAAGERTSQAENEDSNVLRPSPAAKPPAKKKGGGGLLRKIASWADDDSEDGGYSPMGRAVQPEKREKKKLFNPNKGVNKPFLVTLSDVPF